jgi:hypothetical protein
LIRQLLDRMGRGTPTPGADQRISVHERNED